jgi:hypothetical protein
VTIGEAISLVGVLATLGGVTVAVWAILAQGRALRRQLCVQTFAEYTRRYQELLAKVPAELLAGEDRPGILEQHRDKLSLLRAYFDLCFEEYYLHSTGFIEEDLWALWRGGMEYAFARPFISRGWWMIKTSIQYPPDFIAFVEARVQRPVEAERPNEPLQPTGAAISA